MASGTTIKTLVIGVDGGTFSLIRPLADAGRLPTFARLMREGSWGELRSTVPPVTAPSWVSFQTGKNPGKHGVFGFVSSPSAGYERKVLSAASIKARTAWNLLSRAGRRVGILNLPFTYPPEEVNGFVVPQPPGFVPKDRVFSHPPELASLLAREVPEFFQGIDYLRYWFTDEKDEFLAALKRGVEATRRAASVLMERHELDVLVVTVIMTDPVQHFFWKYMDESHPAHDPVLRDKYGEAIHEVYEATDRLMGDLIERMGSETNVIVVSDHGFGPNTKAVSLNQWLRDLGLLKVKKKAAPLVKWRLPFPAYGWLRKLGVPYLDPIVLRQINADRRVVDGRMGLSISAVIDWSRTRAFAGHRSEQGIFLNVRGREPLGIVEPGQEYEELRAVLEAELHQLRDPDDGGKLVDQVWRPGDLYHGEYTDEAPDITFMMRGYEYKANEFIHGSRVVEVERWHTGTHRLDGILLLCGPTIRQGIKMKKSDMTDVAPTLLYLAGVPIPEDMDGRVLTEAVSPEYLSRYPVERSRPDVAPSAREDEQVFSEDEEAAVRKRLKGLGYVG
ncbi:hypothetical protein AMJ39_06420 [candidate division TA06 bacterium DG_24]|uniref:Phosphodiesterase n=3 Tax=Bacteria division TA06 TaxID=1156500 RepID=A0A0S8JM63_UNCT6|nr:MAG: hypothetical protein AMJ39_06420 [candidate division TA06 bacterium DG_24]KPK67822.1 MAG: hypothetical protein AMJ82_09775 [candidate division TA06 bacterium SM23_40]KPL10592.1 MAG: hypothetical protein AMJ71_02600 [candidate division TA06 bacterium SM1_40]